jgi:hypothetical protein
MDAGLAVSLLRYAKGDRCCRIMHLIFYPNHQDEPHGGTASFMSLGPTSLTATGNEADVMSG